MAMVSLQTMFLLVLGWSLPHLCQAQCDRTQFLACIMLKVDMTTDGGSKLRRIIDAEDQYFAAITIEKLIVGGSPSGPFLQRIGAYTDTILYERYREAVFQLPPGNFLTEIDVRGTGMPRSFVAGRNGSLRNLFISNCSLDRIPPTLGELVNLQQLAINQCLLTGLRMDALGANRQLTIVDLSKNRIRELFPIAASSGTPDPAVEQLILTGNQIERLDMAAFARFTQLDRLELNSNRIVQLGASAPVVLPALARLSVAVNKIASVDLTNATLSRLTILFLDNNALAEVPSRWGTTPSLTDLSVEQNRLARLDLSVLRPLVMLQNADFTGNQIESIRCATPVRMPRLELLELASNRISSVSFAGCDLPNVTFLGLSDNRLTTVPALFQRFPNVRLAMDANPLKCAVLKPLMSRLVEERLVMTGLTEPKSCATSRIVINAYQHACCDP